MKYDIVTARSHSRFPHALESRRRAIRFLPLPKIAVKSNTLGLPSIDFHDSIGGCTSMGGFSRPYLVIHELTVTVIAREALGQLPKFSASHDPPQKMSRHLAEPRV